MKIKHVLFFFIIVFLVLFFVLIIGSYIPYPCSGGKWENITSNSSFTNPLEKDKPIVIEALLGSKKIHLLIDTGSTHSYLLSYVIDGIKIKKNQFLLPIYYGDSRLNIRFYPRIVTYEPFVIGPYKGEEIEWFVYDKNIALSEYSKAVGFTIDGVIGRNILNNFIMILDFENKKMLLLRNKEEIPIYNATLATTVPISQTSEIPIILENHNDRMLIDTGSDGYVLKYEFGLLLSKERAEERTFYTSGKEIKHVVKKDIIDIRIGNIVVTYFPVYRIVSFKNFFSYQQLVAGMEFICQFNWIFNFRDSEVTVIVPNKRN